MKKFIKSLSILGTAGLTIAIFMGNRPANALDFVFSQEGWNGGGVVTGTFSGQDTTGSGGVPDGFIKFDDNEVSAYEMNFFGNSTLMAFTHNLDNLVNLTYNLSGDTMEDIIASIDDGGSNYTSRGFGNLGFISQDGDSITTEQTASVREVPEPRSSIGLMFFGLGVYFKKKISKKFFD